MCRLRYEQRAGLAQNPLGCKLFELMARKKTNLSVAADVATVEEMLELADKVSEEALCCCAAHRIACCHLLPASVHKNQQPGLLGGSMQS